MPWYFGFQPAMLYMMALTIMLSPVLVYLYRRAVKRLMNLNSAEPKSFGEGAESADRERIPPPASVVVASKAEQPQGAALLDRLASRRARVTVSYGIAGACYAAILTVIFAARHWDILSKNAGIGLRLLGLVALMFCLPILLTLLHLYSASRPRQGLAVLAVVVATYLLAGAFGEVAIVFFALHLLVPLALFLVLNLRFWRGIAPLTMVIVTPIALGAVVGVYAWQEIGGFELVWVGRLLGAALGAMLGYAGLIALARAHEAGKIGDLEIYLDSWWLLFTVYQTTVWSTRDPIYLLTLASFVVYVVVRRLLLRWLLSPAPVIPNLLLLRVFGFDRRTEQLFDQLTLPWRFVGSVSLIVGPDIAMRSVAPSDYVAFVAGRLRSRFNPDPFALAGKIRSSHSGLPAGGRFPVHQFLNTSDTWQAVMRALGAASQAVVMDLRGFSGDRQGCRIELEYLTATGPSKPVVLLADRTSDTLLIHEIIGAGRTDQQPRLPANWHLVKDASNTREAARHALAHVAARLSGPLPAQAR